MRLWNQSGLKGLMGRESAREEAKGRPAVVEALEERVLMSTSPQIVDVFADNRGRAVLKASVRLLASTVNTTSVVMRTAGVDGVFGTADDVRVDATVRYKGAKRQIIVDGLLSPGTAYNVTVKGNRVQGADGALLDGEFNGASSPSGDGNPGGSYVFTARGSAVKIARFQTTSGNIDVQLFKTRKRATVRNFLQYANSGAWDGTVIHRSIPGFVIQGGGFEVNGADTGYTRIPELAPVANEPGISNTRGTIAMAKLPGDPNSATNEWFFNLGDNSSNLDGQNGGFTVFGAITTVGGLATMDDIAAKQTVGTNAQPLNVPVDGQTMPFTDVPVKDINALTARGFVDLAADSVVVQRVSIAMNVTAS